MTNVVPTEIINIAALFGPMSHILIFSQIDSIAPWKATLSHITRSENTTAKYESNCNEHDLINWIYITAVSCSCENLTLKQSLQFGKLTLK